MINYKMIMLTFVIKKCFCDFTQINYLYIKEDGMFLPHHMMGDFFVHQSHFYD